jgi:hypothetical protein
VKVGGINNVRGSDDMFQHFGWYNCRKDYLGHVAAGRKFVGILDLACPRSVPRAFGFRKRRGNLLNIYAKIVFRKDACHTVNIVCLGKTKPIEITIFLVSIGRPLVAEVVNTYLPQGTLPTPSFS